MRRLLICLAATGTALAAATPAAAQYYPGQPAYGAPHGNAYGRHNFGQIRSLQARLDNVQRQIRRLDRRDRIGDNRADRLRFEADQIENRLQRAARRGLNGYEANDLNVRIARLEQRVQFSMANRWGGGRQWSDRDRDGRNDRFEDDRGYHHD